MLLENSDAIVAQNALLRSPVSVRSELTGALQIAVAKYVSLARKQMRRHRASVHVADAPHSANAFRTVRQAPQFAPQVARKGVDATVGRKIFAVEYAFRQIFAMNDTSAAAQKRREQLKLGGGQF